MTILTGNSRVFKQIFTETLIKRKLIEINKEVEHHTDVYKVTIRGLDFIDSYEAMRGLLGYNEL
jgi:predicted transcriptional regulator